MKQTCETCKWLFTSEVTVDLQRATECHKNPPQVVVLPTPMGAQLGAAFPPTKPTNWCGAYELKLALIK